MRKGFVVSMAALVGLAMMGVIAMWPTHESPAPAAPAAVASAVEAPAAAPVELLASIPVFAQDVVKIVAVARRLHSPALAFAALGDSVPASGVSPDLVFGCARQRFGTVSDDCTVRLSYRPDAGDSNRLESIEITYRPAPTEDEIVTWLGAPYRTESGGDRGRTLLYEGRDTALLAVWSVTWRELSMQIRVAGT